MALGIHPWIMLLLTFLGAVYLFMVLTLSFKERTLVSSLTLFIVFIFIITFAFRPEFVGRFALSGSRIAAGAPYTLFTYMFMHASIAHIFLNALGLLFFGYNIEKEFAAPVMFMIFITSGLVAGAVFVLTSSPSSAVVGASGSIFGLMAYLTLIRPFKISPMPFLIPLPVSLAASIYTVVTIPLFMSGDMGVIAHNAHIGGMIGGALMAFGMNKQQALKGLVVFIFLLLLVIVVPKILFA